MKLYIDTNIYLSYINPASDIKSLEKLKKLIKEKKLELVLPSQTKKEFLNHFKERINQEKEKLAKKETCFGIPNEIKNEKKKKYTKEEEEIIAKINIINEDLKKYKITKKEIFNKHIETIERLINEIFELAIFFEFTNDIVLRAVIRFAKDLPPKKENLKFGDAIIWETLKENIKREEIVIVSFDSDFQIKNKKGISLNKLLGSEWKKHTGKKAILYPVLGQFVNTLEKANPVSQKTINEETKLASAVFPIGYPMHKGVAYSIKADTGNFSITPNSVTLSGSVSPSIFSGPVSASSVLWNGEGTNLRTAVPLDATSGYVVGSSALTNSFDILQANVCSGCKNYYSYGQKYCAVCGKKL